MPELAQDDAKKRWRKQLGDRIAKARRAINISQTDVAKKLGMSKQLVSHWENGVSEITSYQLGDLAEILVVDVAWLLKGRKYTDELSNGSLKLNHSMTFSRLSPQDTENHLVNIDLAIARLAKNILICRTLLSSVEHSAHLINHKISIVEDKLDLLAGAKPQQQPTEAS